MKNVLFSVILFISCAVLGQLKAVAGDPDFTTAQAVANLTPGDAEVQTAGRWNPVGIDAASQAISSGALHRSIVFHLKIQKFEPYHKNGFAYRMKAPDMTVIIHGSHVRCRIWMYFQEDQAGLLARVHKDATLSFSGSLGRADLRMYDGAPVLSLDMKDTHIADNEVL